MFKETDHLKSEDIDIYELLQIPRNSDDSTAKRAYRQQALLYHPDKNKSPEAQTKFHQLSLALTVLSDAEQRKLYDHWLQARDMERDRVEKLGSERRKMKEELETAERKRKWGQRNACLSGNRYALDIERLRKEGSEKMREFEVRYLEKLNHKTTDKSSRTIKVRWRIKSGISSLFTPDVLSGCLSVFGEVEDAKILDRTPSRYDTGIVVFKDSSSAVKAVNYNFNEKSTLWNDTMYKRISGLLREIKWDKEPVQSEFLDKESMTFEEYMDRTLTKLRYLDE
jgi:DnaJ family protein C protein 17